MSDKILLKKEILNWDTCPSIIYCNYTMWLQIIHYKWSLFNTHEKESKEKISHDLDKNKTILPTIFTRFPFYYNHILSTVDALLWIKYCGYGVKTQSINQSINQSTRMNEII